MDNPYVQLSYNGDSKLIDDDAELSEVNQLVENRVIRQNLPYVRRMDEFLDNVKFITQKKDPKMNIWEQGGKFRLFHIPPEDIPVFFEVYDQCRVGGIELNFTEKQNPDASTIRWDFDIFQDSKDSILTERHMHRLQSEFCGLVKRLFELPKREITVYTVITRKNALKFDEKRGKWKDGFHMDHYIKTTKNAKRYLLYMLQKEKILTKVFKELKEPEAMLDMASCWVPLVIYGSAKEGSQPYKIWCVYQSTFDDDGNFIINKDDHFAKSEAHINIAWEMSCNWDAKIIKKHVLAPQEKYAGEIDAMAQKPQAHEGDWQDTINDLNHLTVNDPEASYIKALLDILAPQRYNNRQLWFKVVYALVNTSERYVPLAKWFSKKSAKYDEMGFAKTVQECLSGKKYPITIESLYFWASKDSPEKFRVANEKSCFITLAKYVFDPIIEGKLGHTHYAELVYLFLKNKYVTDYRGKQRIWYEFKFPQDKLEKGQVFKWCEIQNPDSLDIYLHRKVHQLNAQMVTYLNTKMRKTDDKNMVKYYTKIMRNFKSSARGLWMEQFKASVIKQSEKMFISPGFIKSLDLEVMGLGVANGILLLSHDGSLPKLIKSYHSLRISRYTSTPYKQFDPKDPTTRKLLRALRSMHLDDQTDAYEYKMSLKAASIDYRPREPLMLLITGPGRNGKSSEFELHINTLGEQYGTTMPIAILLQSKDDNPEGPKPFLMKLEKARAAYYEEGPICAVLYMAMVKRLTGCSTLHGARGMFENADRVIKSRCYHFVLSNHDFIVQSHEEAVWARLRYLPIPIIFKDVLDFNPKNPTHRLMDRTFNAEFLEAEETRSAYLSIMTFQHMKLMKKYGGIVEHVPHPTIDKETLAFRNRQDTLNRFITERVIVSSEQAEATSLEKVTEMYTNWYDKNVRVVRHFMQDIQKQFLDSALKDFIEETIHGHFLKKGFRVLNVGDELRPGEVSIKKYKEEKKEGKDNKDAKDEKHSKKYAHEFPTETPDQYLDRVEKEWKEMLDTCQADTKVDLTKSYVDDDDMDDNIDLKIDDAKAKLELDPGIDLSDRDPNLVADSDDDRDGGTWDAKVDRNETDEKGEPVKKLSLPEQMAAILGTAKPIAADEFHDKSQMSVADLKDLDTYY